MKKNGGRKSRETVSLSPFFSLDFADINPHSGKFSISLKVSNFWATMPDKRCKSNKHRR
jgi:hypothetical protein